MPVEFSFGQVEAVCASLNRIAQDKRVAFMSRLKQLQKQGLTPQQARPGRGKAGTYSFGDLMRFVISLELIQSGIMPQMAARLVNGSWSLLRMNIYTCSFAPEETVGFSKKPTEYLWMLSVEALRGLTAEGEGEWDHMERIEAVPIAEASQMLARGVGSDPETYGEGWRTLVLNGHNLTQRVMKVVAFHFAYASRAEMRAGILAEIEEHDKEMKSLGHILEDRPPPTPEQEERMAQSREKFRALDEADWSTNPPTPRHVLAERANELIPVLPAGLKEFLSGPDGASFELDVELSRDDLRQFLDLGIFAIEAVEDPYGPDTVQGLALTPFGRILVKQLGGPWAQAIETADAAPRRLDPIDHEADKVIAGLTPEMIEKIKGDDTIFEDPYRSDLLALGLIEFGEAPFPFGESGSWTELGRAVLFALRFGRHRHALEQPPKTGSG